MESDWQTRAGPAHRPTPGPGSRARTRTACGTPSSRVTKLRQWCIPYTKYTYARPAGPNITLVRGVRPRKECAARSSGPQ